MDESGDFWRSVTTEMTVRHNKCEPAPPTAFQSVLAVAAAVMQRGTPQKRRAPLCISDTSPHAKEGDLDEVTGAAGIFMLNENEEIVRAQIRNYVQVVDAREDTREILPWQDCIDTIAQGTNLGERVTITEVELNLSLGKNGMTYPVWRFAGYSDLTFLRTLNPEVVINSSDFSCCVDAYTGQCLYY